MTTEVTEGTAESLPKSEEQSPVTFDELGGTVNLPTHTRPFVRAHHPPVGRVSFIQQGELGHCGIGRIAQVYGDRYKTLPVSSLQLQKNAVNDS